MFANQAGFYDLSDIAFTELTQLVSETDTPPLIVSYDMPFQRLLKSLRSSDADTRTAAVPELRRIVSEHRRTFSPYSWVAFSYLAFLAQEPDIYQELVQGLETQGKSPQLEGYRHALTARAQLIRKDYRGAFASIDKAISSLNDALSIFAEDSTDTLPSLTDPERTVLSVLVSPLIDHAETERDRDIVYKLQQLLVRDKSTLGLSLRTSFQSSKAALERVELQTEARAKNARNSLTDEIVNALIDHVDSEVQGAPQGKSFAIKERLEFLEDTIQRIRGEKAASRDEFITVARVSKLLKQDEAAITHTISPDGRVSVSCVTDNTASFKSKWIPQDEFKRILVDEKLITAAVRGSHPPSATLDAHFPTDSAYRLYKVLFDGIGDCLTGRSHLIMATDPDLFNLPWNALVTELPPDGPQSVLKSVPWFIKKFAFSIAPSVQSFVRLRELDHLLTQAKRKFLGIGNPIFAPDQKETVPQNRPLFVMRDAGSVSISSLPPLPETEGEITEIARSLPATDSVTLLGAEASERSVRQQPLREFQVISFATHALIPGEIDGISEPAIVLTPGSRREIERNDGVLTAAEISQLELEANLVVLSACNTAAPDNRRSGRALSGLADAFFVAGARSLAVTQWSILSLTAAQIGSSFVRSAVHSERIGVAKVLQSTLVNYIDRADHDYLAHPRFWAAMLIAGDGMTAAIEPPSISKWPTLSNIDISREGRTRDAVDGVFVKNENAVRLIGLNKEPNIEIGDTFLATIPDGTEDASVVTSEAGAGRIMNIDDREFLFTQYVPRQATALFHLYIDSEQRWTARVKGGKAIMPIGGMKSDQGYVVMALIPSESNNEAGKLLVLSLNHDGSELSRSEHELDGAANYSLGDFVSIDDNRALIAIPLGGRSQFRNRINTQTGSTIFCSPIGSTQLIELDIKTLAVIRKALLDGINVTRLKRIGGKVFVATKEEQICGIRQARIQEVRADLTLAPQISIESSGEIEVRDFSETRAGWILGGTLFRFSPLHAWSKRGADVAGSNIWADEIFETNEFTFNGYLAEYRNGVLSRDFVLSDARSSSINRIIQMPSNDAVIAGARFGDRAWVTRLRN